MAPGHERGQRGPGGQEVHGDLGGVRGSVRPDEEAPVRAQRPAVAPGAGGTAAPARGCQLHDADLRRAVRHPRLFTGAILHGEKALPQAERRQERGAAVRHCQEPQARHRDIRRRHANRQSL